ncbi:putative glutathione transporter, permease component [Pseudonocardia sp. Ae406_Ps2]|uniref:ABC transporter permease n=1 Tax=unclassified Pseudonocardia TaxID=2619320 RepID=UPI000310AE06|nr:MULTISPECIES: ABC transporter permease [unclassified Pseudonocardia]OLM01518.1 putative glutathione transporter, permease component [Pseudonocardia sp. Ae406_Ps2]OLM06680.1 putative glutathione transporter, permease component [Pseudonocardia sp. Ae331_Ps2]OLM23089.1 putative glutathione transporter, permease component [Pseudonocardia sp. Ae706_Ps2]OLM32161.1 putative glutathione transporter, permease component [Pseudonocardia sp. Ae717_Ps2]
MLRYLAVRAGQGLVTLLLASVVVFAGVRALPGDPALALAGEEATPETVAAIRDRLGLDGSLVEQYLRFLGSALTGDLGESTRTGTPVTELIAATLPVTAWLSLYAIVVAVVAGMAAGTLAAVYRGRGVDAAVSGLSLVSLSVPNFWLGLLAILYLAVGLGLFPASGYVAVTEDPLRALWHLTLPALILGTGLAAIVMRQTRASMVDTLTADFVRTARAKGVSRGAVVLRHALRNSLLVVLTIVGLQLGGLVSGAVVTERIFGLPGFGKLTLDSVFTRDYPVIQGVVLVVTLAYIVINLAVDVLYSVVDPRVRVEGRSR